MNLIFVAAILPPLLAVLAWTVVTIFRICFPERALPFGIDSVWLHQQAVSQARGELVGARDIRDEHRRILRAHPPQAYTYCGVPNPSSGIPDDWMDDLWFRRN